MTGIHAVERYSLRSSSSGQPISVSVYALRSASGRQPDCVIDGSTASALQSPIKGSPNFPTTPTYVDGVRTTTISITDTVDVARVLLPASESEGPFQPHPARMVSIRHPLWQLQGRFRLGPEDAGWEWRPHAARGACCAHLRCERVHGKARVREQRWGLPHPPAAGPAGHPDRVREVSARYVSSQYISRSCGISTGTL